jgi:hypothetical protein
MTRKLFRSGGPLGIEHLGNHQYRMNISLPPDQDGRIARECPRFGCTPAYFKVRPGTGLAGMTVAYCPYCRHDSDPNDFATREQVRYAKDLAVREAHRGLDGIVKDALGIGPSGKRALGGGMLSMTLTYKPGTLPSVRRPYEDEVRRDVVCPHCALDHTVFGLATWCADCGEDIFLTHVQSELAVTRSMVGDLERRREALGPRVAAKDLENCLEDAVSLFEAAMKALSRRWLAKAGASEGEVETRLRKLGNGYQNIAKTMELLPDVLGIKAPASVEWDRIGEAFKKRHPITHNLGVVDRKYLERSQSHDRHGREVRITAFEVQTLLNDVMAAVSVLHASRFRSPPLSGAVADERG